MLYIFNGGSPVPLGYITLDGVEGVKKVTLFRHIIILCAWTAPGGRNTHYTCFVWNERSQVRSKFRFADQFPNGLRNSQFRAEEVKE